MLGKLRSFSKSKLAGVLVAIIIVPFVFWGMGSVFSGGNTNSIVKINNYNISTKDFVTHLNKSGLTQVEIRENLKNNILEEQLAELISMNIVDIEIKNLNFSLSEKSLVKIIKQDKNLQDDEGNFSRIKYEKLLLENNLSASDYENILKRNELKNKLFAYISGGIRSPYFKANKIYTDQNKEIDLNYIKLNNFYKKKNDFTETEINEYIKNNEDKLKKDAIDFSYIKITPQKLIQSDNFNQEFFDKIDSIENEIFNGSGVKNISSKYNLELLDVSNYMGENSKEDFFDEIYEKKNQEKIQLIDKNEFFLIYEINNIEKILPTNKKFKNFVTNKLYELNKFNYNKNLLEKIQNKKFTQQNFFNLADDDQKIEKILLKSISEENLFSNDSNKLIYSRPKKSFLLINDNENNIYLAFIENIIINNISKSDIKINTFRKLSNYTIKSNLYSSYDVLVNKKYKIEINKKTLERFKNQFN